MKLEMQSGVSMSAGLVIWILAALALCPGALAQDAPSPTDKKVKYSPYPEQNFPNQVFFGDTHLHTSYSTDAGMIGNRLGPEDAYRFARGETVKSSTGLPARLSRPLDFLVVTDHAENLGLAPMIAESNPRATSPDDSAGLPDLEEFAKSIPDLDLYDSEIAELSPEDKIELAIRAERAARDYSPLIVNFDGGGFDSSSGSVILANSFGFAAEYSGTSCSLATVPVAAEEGKMQRDYWYDVRRKFKELDSPETIGVMAAKRTLRKLGARPVPTQNVPVVFEPNIARDLLGDIFTAISGESVFRKASFLVGQLGESVASGCLTIIDDGIDPGRLGSRPFDGEGLPTRRTVVVRKGVLESYLLNTYTGRKLGLRSTGNASRGLVGVPSVEPGNLYIEPGEHSPSEIIGSLSKGLLITELIGFGVNIVTGDYSRSASGIWIENGQPSFPVQGVTIAGNLKEMLNSIEMVGNDLDYRGNILSPTLLIGQMTVSA